MSIMDKNDKQEHISEMNTFLKKGLISQDNTLVSNHLPELWRTSLEKEGGQWFRVVSPSMYPLIGIGDWIWVEPLGHAGPRPGDIVAFYDSKRICVHRIIGSISDDRFIELGDAVRSATAIHKTQLIGVVTRIRRGNLIVLDLRSKTWRLVNGYLFARSLFRYRLQRWFPPLRPDSRGILTTWTRKAVAGWNRVSPHRFIRWFIKPVWKQSYETIDVAGHPLRVMIPPGRGECEQGLRCFKTLPEDMGLLFIFDNEYRVTLHSMNVNFPLSVAFIDKNLVIQGFIDLEPGVPMRMTKIASAFVLEVNLGWFARHRVSLGAQLGIEGFNR